MQLEGCPLPGLILPSEKVQGSDDVREIGNEFAVEVSESKERSDSFHGCWGFPFANSSEFGRIHLHLSLPNDHAEEVYVRGILEPSFSDHVGKDTVHKCLEGGGSIAEPEEHNRGFKRPKGVINTPFH
jgi:hypothetical protein